MIKQYLEDHYSIDRLHSSYLVNTDKIDLALGEIESFIKDKILTEGNLKTNPDYMYVEKADSTSRNISVEQIRKLQSFLYKTSVLSGQKIALIYAADKMNINAANCCLKILEEPPANTHLFVLTENAASLIPTIRSRCVKINHHYDQSKTFEIDEKFIKPLLKSTSIANKLAFIKQFSVKDRDIWIDFSSSAESLLAKFCKNIIGYVSLTSMEQELLLQFKSTSLQYLQDKYSQVQGMIDETNEFDLDLQASCTLLMDVFRR